MRTRLFDLDSARPADLDLARSPRRRAKGFWKAFACGAGGDVGEVVWDGRGRGDFEAGRGGGSSAVGAAAVAAVREAGTAGEGIGSERSSLGAEEVGAEGGGGFTDEEEEEGTGG